MIPSLLDRQVRQGVSDFVRTTFSITTPSFGERIEELCENRLFQGPYVSQGLPFEESGSTGKDFFPHLSIANSPYKHQELAWNRLKSYESTLVATGTGSGKTECFLYPVLEHARAIRECGWAGVKAILIYPMNALATDQARRIAKTIAADPALKGKVTAGLYVGGEQEKPSKTMLPEAVITDRETMRLNPPDILLTNYKMLDYLLTRPHDQALWAQNKAAEGDAPSTLRYLVVDELHTFDGAQGTDLAMLVRRLKARLGCGNQGLCCVGTSATLGGQNAAGQMLDYAQKVFGQSFTTHSLITEQRKSPKDFLDGAPMSLSASLFPQWAQRAALELDGYASQEDYVQAQIPLWFAVSLREEIDDRVSLGEALRQHAAFRTWIEIAGSTPRLRDELIAEMGRVFQDFSLSWLRKCHAGVDEKELRHFLALSLESLIALTAWARRENHGKVVPFVQSLRVQSWIRELRRMVATVGKGEALRLDYADDLAGTETRFLPVVFCRECGSAGWAGLVSGPNSDQLRGDAKALRDFYKTFFDSTPSQLIRLLFPDLQGKAILRPQQGATDVRLCTACLRMLAPGNKPCSCGCADWVDVLVPDTRFQNSKGKWFTRKLCPGCGTRQSLVVLGAQSASLSSALINQLYASRYNDDKKLIAFSDNVQDASHRASFFGARTWKFNLRAAIQQVVLSQGGSVALGNLGQRVVDHWRHEWQDDVKAAVFFLPSDLHYLNEFREMQAGKRQGFSEEFWTALVRRIDWEVFTEYTLDCRKGRTLEKSGSSLAYIPRTWGQADLENLSDKLQSLVPPLRGIVDAQDLEQVLRGMLLRWMHNGAVEHPALSTYIASLGSPYNMNKYFQFMKGFGKNTRTPALPWRQIVGADREERLDPIDTQPHKPSSWYAHWLLKHWGNECPGLLVHYEEIMTTLLQFLMNLGLLQEHDVQKTKVWCLRMDQVQVAAQVAHGQCSQCGHWISWASSMPLGNTPLRCQKPSCSGCYTPRAQAGNYYGDLYAHGDLVRLIPHEHTSLLQREEREDVETRFKAGKDVRKSWDPNLLSCTPTLEMGIDIGDLSSVLLCSVPPKQAAFLQRIGRAGRTDGNALIETIAEGNPHDLYYWSDPMELMGGNVDAPGVFLNATAVLERQLTAFALDCWVSREDQAEIPRNVSALLRNWANKNKPEAFPHSFLKFAMGYHQTLAQNFCDMLAPYASAETKAYLHAYLDPLQQKDSLPYRIQDCLDLASQSRKSLNTKRKQIEADLLKGKDNPAYNPELLEELEMERIALTALIRNLDERDCYQFLTDEGLIPNYAFPEAGVQLKSLIYMRKPAKPTQEKGTRQFKKVFEYERAAASAISDFAPGNFFYAHGRKVQIDQVDVGLSKPTRFRICPECGYTEEEIHSATPAECPQCRSHRFGGVQQVHELLRVRQVYATSSDSSSLVGDDSDSRDVRFFERNLLVRVHGSELLGAYEQADPLYPFGFEVRRKVSLREINFGPYDSNAAKLEVAGQELSAKGFCLCKSCGKVQIDNKEIAHTFHCQQQHPNKNQVLLDAMFLYRDFEGEALRIFLPTLSQGAEVEVKSFLAALHLGLKLHYLGDISHLQATVQSEPVPDAEGLRKQFIVLYDAVPGGTGYLKQFADPQNPGLLLEVLQKAMQRLATCACQHTAGRDGCYQCLLAHRNSREMELISRKQALQTLQQILRPNASLKPSTAGVSAIALVSLLESELERKFIQVLKAYADNPQSRHRVRLEARLLQNKNGYRLVVDSEAWILEPQVEIGPAQGIVSPTRADFVLYREANSATRPVALYLDGWEYHKNRVVKDTRQRLALHRSGNYRFWTLTWPDLDDLCVGKPQAFGMLDVKNAAGLQKFLASQGKSYADSWRSFGNLRLLLEYLANPDDVAWQTIAYAIGLGNFDNTQSQSALWSQRASAWLPQGHKGWQSLAAGYAADWGMEEAKCDLWVGRNMTDTVGVLTLNDSHLVQDSPHPAWYAFWRGTNILQFLADFVFVAQSGMNDGDYAGIPMHPIAPTDPCQPSNHEWGEAQEAFELYEDGVVVAQAERAWPEHSYAIVSTPEDQDAFEKAGYTVKMLA